MAIRSHYQKYLNNDIDGLKSLESPDLKIYMNSTQAMRRSRCVGLKYHRFSQCGNQPQRFHKPSGIERL